MGARPEGRGDSLKAVRELAGLFDPRRCEDRRAAGERSTIASRRGEGDAEVRIQATLDDAGRARLGIGLADTLTGPIRSR